jgi:hypothetical protein
MVNQNPAHDLRSHGTKVSAALPAGAPLIHHAEKRLMHQSCRLPGVTLGFPHELDFRPAS